MKFVAVLLGLASCAFSQLPFSDRAEADPWEHFDQPRGVPFPDEASEELSPKLKAATKTLELGKRDGLFAPLNQLEFVYTENEQRVGPHGVDMTQRATLAGLARYPTYFPEKYRDVQVACYMNTIHLTFDTDEAFRNAQEQTRDSLNATIVTSHYGCQEPDARKTFKVKEVSYHTETRSIKFEAAKRPLRDVFRTLSIEFDQTNEHHVHRSIDERDRLRRRQASPTTFTENPMAGAWAPLPSGTATDNQPRTTDLNWSLINKTLDLPNISAWKFYLWAVVGCNNCTQTGTVSFSHGKFDLNLDLLDWASNPNKANPLTEGWVQMDLKEYSLHLDMYAIGHGGLYWMNFLSNATLPHDGWKIEGIGWVGLQWAPAIITSLDFASPTKYGYGVDVKIPNLSMRVDVGSLNASTQGFEDAEVTPHGMTSNTTTPQVKLAVKFVPRIPLTFKLGVDYDEDGMPEPSGGIGFYVGTYLFLPLLDITMEPGCPSLPYNGTTGNGTNAWNGSDSLSTRPDAAVAQFKPRISLSGGIEIIFEYRLDNIDPGAFTRIELAGVTSTFPQVCYSLETGVGTWVPFSTEGDTNTHLVGWNPSTTTTTATTDTTVHVRTAAPPTQAPRVTPGP
ncbi:Uu.00g114820.m01.CDS01 [Anthostomella pinea]|uniref:Uu.00g114820.m01.CDS01 n=1 Tax=Anthostomella pinea TaxID=933095 RepID=A0AAI8VFM0_9PEZI|nr:Uu.00g114820.m01.CDS01 [Anthostomella pinea]